MSNINFLNVETHLDDASCQFVDIREPYELQMDGFIKGFQCIPFYTALLHKNIVTYVRDPQQENAVLNEEALGNLFDKDKALYLMCNSGTRSGYLTFVLKQLGYNVTNLGGIHDYHEQKKKA